MASMNEKELKIGDIAHLTGISEQEVRALVQTYDSLFTYRTLGRARLFPQKTVGTVQKLIELSGKGLSPEEIVKEAKLSKKRAESEGAAEEIGRNAAPLPPEVVIDLGVMRDTLARQERRIARLVDELEREQQRRMEEVGRLQMTVDDLQKRLSRQQEQLAVVAEWVDYFDRQMDEATRPVLERVRRTVTKKDDPGQPSGRSG
ncbi:hypothetical protein HL657_00310 [Methanoculleus sp. YWC-01]|jgi:DNA-binding transcriptional MerR regulator|uniref:MerR family transcriptional regulator n=1 Tax=Methanoculleus nereidis TaxID=2735141 RepID=A0ABU3YZ55_9EURY|nr:hypothetical protein [Methanoculleus sp. YWC-01]MCK9298451.1 hypothetical protein [Methanoculleus sp.]MDV4341639.1 hypothetical protein [Methanoculleus sp. YWC-01]PKL56829.1 MAG: hypothetical protein CVV35_02825 [Methanomicrobiales archaeon HGW-Methanomicrobiales-6]